MPKINFIRTWSCCISNKGNEVNNSMLAYIFTYTHPRIMGWGLKGSVFFAYQINENEA